MRKNTHTYLLKLMALMLVLSASCAKHDGFYDFENTEYIFEGSTEDYLRSKGVYDSLLLVLDRLPDYKDSISEGQYTLFAPTNSSFRLAINNLNLVRQAQNKPDLSLSTVEEAELDTLMSRYIVQGLQVTDSMVYVDGLDVNPIKYPHSMHAQQIQDDASGLVKGGLITIYYTDKKNSTFEINWSRAATQAVNIKTATSVIHVLANGHEFGFGDFLERMNK